MAPTITATPKLEPTPANSPISTVSNQPESKKVIEISISSNGLSQNNLALKIGETIKFVNKDTVLHWPATGPHPTHTLCPGFDALKGLAQGESYSFTFDKVMVCPFHDHLHARNTNFSGVITVK